MAVGRQSVHTIAEQAGELMHAHMIEAERLMLENAAKIERHFLVADEVPPARSA